MHSFSLFLYWSLTVKMFDLFSKFKFKVNPNPIYENLTLALKSPPIAASISRELAHKFIVKFMGLQHHS